MQTTVLLEVVKVTRFPGTKSLSEADTRLIIEDMIWSSFTMSAEGHLCPDSEGFSSVLLLKLFTDSKNESVGGLHLNPQVTLNSYKREVV